MKNERTTFTNEAAGHVFTLKHPTRLLQGRHFYTTIGTVTLVSLPAHSFSGLLCRKPSAGARILTGVVSAHLLELAFELILPVVVVDQNTEWKNGARKEQAMRS